MTDFPCTSCGGCCRRAGHIPEFPREWVLDDKSCALLTADNRCAIYDERPDICRIDVGAELSDMDRTEYHQLTASLCNMFMEQDGITDRLIDLTIFGDRR